MPTRPVAIREATLNGVRYHVVTHKGKRKYFRVKAEAEAHRASMEMDRQLELHWWTRLHPGSKDYAAFSG
jgi:hypothetical protein